MNRRRIAWQTVSTWMALALIAASAMLTACSHQDNEDRPGSPPPVTTGLAAVSAGFFHSCALTSTGGAKCWGHNRYGQLGTGSTSDSSNPSDVVGLHTGVIAISAGLAHTCAVTSVGGVKCWGMNGDGRLGTGAAYDSSVPADVSGLGSGVVAVSTGDYHTCALTRAGAVKCWGQNSAGQLGNGTRADSLAPTDVVGLSSGVSAISAGQQHTCAVTSVGGVKCWGENGAGTLGNGSTAASSTPVDASGLSSGVDSVSAGGAHTCALTRVGGVKCWGQGQGPSGHSLTPVDISGLGSGVVAVSAGSLHTCALTRLGGVKCWGQNPFGELGQGNTSDSATPMDVVELNSGASAVSAGGHHTCALTHAGSARCWGYGVFGELGNGVDIRYAVPARVGGLTQRVSAVGAGGSHTCAVTRIGGVVCWGSNRGGQLGNGTTADSFAPVEVNDLRSGVSAVGAGASHSCAITAAGGVVCWGDNWNGQLGNGSNAGSSTPVNVIDLGSGVSAIAAGWSHTCAITGAGGVVCWGSNWSGQLGDGTKVDSAAPRQVIGLSSEVGAISAGTSHTCALTVAGGVSCWGGNAEGQLGNGTTTDSLTPTDVIGLSSGVVAISAGGWHTCALTSAGGVKCWGYNGDGRLGNGNPISSPTPVDVRDLRSGVVAVSAGGYHTCALTGTGGVKCWGGNTEGQLGNGTTSGSMPADVIGLSTGVSAISAGFSHTCALTAAGGVECWGITLGWLLGNGGTSYYTRPVDVVDLVI